MGFVCSRQPVKITKSGSVKIGFILISFLMCLLLQVRWFELWLLFLLRFIWKTDKHGLDLFGLCFFRTCVAILHWGLGLDKPSHSKRRLLTEGPWVSISLLKMFAMSLTNRYSKMCS